MIKILEIQLNNFYLKKGAEYYNHLLETKDSFQEVEAFFGILGCSFRLAKIYELQGNYDEALQISFTVFRDLGPLIDVAEKKRVQFYEMYFDVSKAIASIYFNRGNHKETLNYIIEAEKVANFLVEIRPSQTKYKDYLAGCYDVVGDIYGAEGNLEESLSSRLRSFEIRELIMDKNAFSATAFFNITVSAQRVGHIYQLQKQCTLAEKYYKIALQNALKWGEFKTNNVLESDLLPIAYENMGNIYKDMNRLNDAFDYYEKYHILMKEIHLQNPNLLQSKNLYALSLLKLARVSHLQQKLLQAIEYYYQSCTVFKELIITSNLNDNNYLYNFAFTCIDLTNTEKGLYQVFDTSLTDKENVKNIRRDAQNMSQLLMSRSPSTHNFQWLYQQLSDESWYQF
ncbi:MAG: tetratricopeptide repeat protein [Arcicella sp.]|jgi:tetratricopeptide (TPR) repeat protein|nr:tetratricopeptide repeat protein [Arcicella sp.]